MPSFIISTTNGKYLAQGEKIGQVQSAWDGRITNVYQWSVTNPAGEHIGTVKTKTAALRLVSNSLQTVKG